MEINSVSGVKARCGKLEFMTNDPFLYEVGGKGV